MANGSTGSPFFDVGLLLQHLLPDLFAADEEHLLQQRPLHHVENHDPPAGHLLPVGPHVDEHVRAVEPADVLLDPFEVEGPAHPGANVRQNFFQRQRLVAANLHVDDHLGRRSGGRRSGGRRPGRMAIIGPRLPIRRADSGGGNCSPRNRCRRLGTRRSPAAATRVPPNAHTPVCRGA